LWRSIKAGEINSLAIDRGTWAAKPGNTLEFVDNEIREFIVQNKCTPAFLGYRGYPKSSCLSVNNIAVHGIPNDYVLKAGDVLTIDVGTIYKGWYTDAANTIIVGLSPDNFDKNSNGDLVHNTNEVLYRGLEIFAEQSKVSLYDLAKRIEDAASELKLTLIPSLGGHRINKGVLHQEPFIHNVLPKDPKEIQKMKEFYFEPGMMICIEPVATMGDSDIFVGSDGWSCYTSDSSVAAHFEAMILITNPGNYRIISN
jgi:methionyl aminopeptidase